MMHTRRLERFPLAVLFSWLSGYMTPCLRTLKEVYVVAGSDAQWTGSPRQRIGQLVAPWYLPSAVDVLWVADFVVLPYRCTFTSQSGVLNVAVSYERPVVVSSAPILSETVERSNIGVVCGSDEPRGLARGIEETMARSRDGHHFSCAGYRRCFSWSENARRTLSAYILMEGGA